MIEFWQFITEDWLGLLINAYFGIALIPAIKDIQKTPLSTSLPTGLGLVTLGIIGSFTAAAVNMVVIGVGLVWLILGWQRWRQGQTRRLETSV